MSHLAEGTQPSENIDPHLYLQANASAHREGAGGPGSPDVSQCSGTHRGLLSASPNCPNMLPVCALVLRARTGGAGCARPAQGSPEEQGQEVQVVLDQLRIPWLQNPRKMGAWSAWHPGNTAAERICPPAALLQLEGSAQTRQVH